MLRTVTFNSHKPGPRYLVLGAIHGNEKCGTLAIERIINEIESKNIVIAKGSVTFVPICNPRAFEKNTRFIERNLNRYLLPQNPPQTYEAELGNELCPYLAKCDYLLDIHSYTVGGEPFACVDGNLSEENEFALALGAYALVGLWEKAYAASDKSVRDPNEAVGTTVYARRHGAQAVVLECGQHLDPRAPEIAYQAILNGFRFLKMIDGKSLGSVSTAKKNNPLEIDLTTVIYRTDEGSFSENWQNFSAVKKGQVVARRANGELISAAQNSYIVMPKVDCPIGAEWFYLGSDKIQETSRAQV